jgi:hypothetical protein
LLGLLLLGAALPVCAQEQTVSFVGQIGGECRDVQVVGAYAYVGEGTSLRVLDVSNPARPVPRGRVRLPGVVQSVFVSGGRAYVTDGASLQIADIANPSSPTLLGAHTTPAKRVWVSGNLAYVATGSSLKIINVASPSSPTLRTTYNASATNVYLSGTRAYLSGDKLRILDVSNPSSPTLRGSYNTPINDVVVSGTLAYLACPNRSGLKIVDVSNPSSPTLRSSLTTPDEMLSQSIRVSGNRAYFTWVHGPYYFPQCASLRIVDVSNPSQPRLLGSYDDLRYACGLLLVGGLAYVADGRAGLQIVDVSQASQPAFRGFYGAANDASDVCLSGNLAYVAGAEAGFQIINVANPTSPTVCGSCRTPGDAVAVCTSGNLAYVAWSDLLSLNEGGGLQIIDVTNLSSPTLRGRLDSGRWTWDVAASGELAYLAHGAGSLTIIDVSNPSSPTLRGSYVGPPSDPFGTSHVSAGGGRAYLASPDVGVQIIDCTNPSSPTLCAIYRTAAADVQVVGNRAYVACADHPRVFEVLDVTNPSSPTLLGSRETRPYSDSVFVSGSAAYVTCTEGSASDRKYGLEILDVSNPRAPGLRGFYDLPAWAAGVCASGNLAYVSDTTGGLWILRYTAMPPAAPSDLRASAISWDEIDLTWLDNSLYADGLKFERKAGLAGTWAETTITMTYVPVFYYQVTLQLAYRDTAVSPGIDYFYRLRAYNSTGYSAYSNVTSATITNGPPEPPSNLAIVRFIQYGPLFMVWRDNSNNEQGFRIECREGSADPWTLFTTTTANTTYNYAATNLPADTTCFYRVRAYNPRGASACSNEAMYSTALPTKPLALMARVVAATEVILSWQDNSDNEQGFTIYRKTGISTSWASVGGVGMNVTCFLDPGLSRNTLYTYRVTAYNWKGTADSNEVTVTTQSETAVRATWSLYE